MWRSSDSLKQQDVKTDEEERVNVSKLPQETVNSIRAFQKTATRHPSIPPPGGVAYNSGVLLFSEKTKQKIGVNPREQSPAVDQKCKEKSFV